MAGLAVLVSWEILNGPQDFFHTFSMALCHKWDVKNYFSYVLQFLSLISDGVGIAVVKKNSCLRKRGCHEIYQFTISSINMQMADQSE